MHWSKPYCNTTHLSGAPFRCQITMRLFDDGNAEAYMLNKDREFKVFTPVRSCYGPEDLVRAEAESWVKLGPVTDEQPEKRLTRSAP